MGILLDSPVLVSILPHQNRAQPTLSPGASGQTTYTSGWAQLWDFTSRPGDSANLTNREVILSYITANPGVYLRELTEDLGLCMGVVQYHVWALTRDGQVEDCRSGRFRRFFKARAYQETERMVLSLLKQGTTGRILVLLAKRQPLAHLKLAWILGISSQGLSWQMGRLRRYGIIEASTFQGTMAKEYRLTDGALRAVSHALGDGPATNVATVLH
jgi:predicted ArsR family transcriptional regulator